MSHLGDRVASLVDGQLAPDQAEKANIHIAGCAGCRSAVEAERMVKQSLSSLGPVEPRADFLQQLMGMAGPSGPLPPRPGRVPGTPRPEYARVPVGVGMSSMAAPVNAPTEFSAEAAYDAYGAPALGIRERPPARRGSVRPAGSRASRRARARVAVAMVGAACLVGAGVAGGLANSAATAGPQVSPAIASFVGEHVATTTTLPLSDTSLTSASLTSDHSLNWGTAGAGR